jgi:hypothetical protein
MDAKEFNEQLEKLTDKEDTHGIEAFANSLSADDLHLYKDEFIEAYLNTFSLWYYDLICHKVSEDRREGVINEMFEILTLAKKISPELNFNRQRAQCYEYLSELKKEPEDKLLNIQKAIDQYLVTLNTSPQYKAPLANALLDKILITANFSDDEFQKILDLLESAFETYSEGVASAYAHACFRILEFPFSKSQYWHEQFFSRYNAALAIFVKEQPIIILTWVHTLAGALQYRNYNITDEYADELNNKSIALMEDLVDFQTENHDLLNQLGSTFERAAKRMDAGATKEKLRYFNIALTYFTKGQLLKPATWTFPVYATNVLKAMAVIYHNQGDSVIELFELGRTHFSKVDKHEEDFTLNLYWGEFLVEYARLAYNFEATDILEEATAKSLLAKALGRGFYSQPFFLLAKIALKRGIKEECMEILKECKAVFTTEYHVYDLAPVLRDADFKEIWDDPILIP